MKTIPRIRTTEPFLIRHPVLRTGKSGKSCRFDRDNLETTLHHDLFPQKKHRCRFVFQNKKQEAQ
jgi:hypothetical protein